MSIEYADANGATVAMFKRAHPTVVAAVNAARRRIGLEPIAVRGNPAARPLERRGGRLPVAPQLPPEVRFAAAKKRAAAVIARLKRLQLGR